MYWLCLCFLWESNFSDLFSFLSVWEEEDQYSYSLLGHAPFFFCPHPCLTFSFCVYSLNCFSPLWYSAFLSPWSHFVIMPPVPILAHTSLHTCPLCLGNEATALHLSFISSCVRHDRWPGTSRGLLPRASDKGRSNPQHDQSISLHRRCLIS